MVNRQAADDDSATDGSDTDYGDRTGNINQAITLPQAMAAVTRESAEPLGIAEETVTIEPGKSADFIAIDRDIFTGDIKDVHNTQVVGRWVAGQSS